MTMTREDMLRELGLLPVWRLREPLSGQPNKPAREPLAKPALDNAKVIDSELAEIELIVDVPVTMADAQVFPPNESTDELQVSEASTMLRLLVSEDTNWLFLLEHISAQEQETLLQNMLRAISVKTNVDITNVKLTQLAHYQPKVMLVFGEKAMQGLLGNTHSFEGLRLKQHEQQPATYQAIPVIVTYHPSHLLQHLPIKAQAWDDLRLAMRLVAQTS